MVQSIRDRLARDPEKWQLAKALTLHDLFEAARGRKPIDGDELGDFLLIEVKAGRIPWPLDKFEPSDDVLFRIDEREFWHAWWLHRRECMRKLRKVAHKHLLCNGNDPDKALQSFFRVVLGEYDHDVTFAFFEAIDGYERSAAEQKELLETPDPHGTLHTLMLEKDARRFLAGCLRLMPRVV
jgi:hypothetical protein